jgi:acetyl coenzyme A synthetase (ADP forming)-like protein
MPESSSGRPAHSLDAVFSPRSIAVVGASRNRNSIGFALLHNLVSNQFNGTIFPVNPHAQSIHSLKAYPTLADIPDPVDLAVIMVPRRLVQGIVEEALEIGVRGLVVITAGFAETGEEGAALERRVRDTVRGAGARMIGPNCMGVINTEPEFSLDATFSPTPARRGSIGFVSQSGALGVAVLNAAADLSVGLTQFVSMGNKADVSGNDLMEYWEDDPTTRVICMYLESFGNPRRFTEIAKRVSRKKPILIVKSGRTAEGARAASSHTGAIAGADLPVSAFLRQLGVLRANTIDELFDVARALDLCPLPTGHRVAVLTNAGGPAIMATDACVNLGLEMAELSDVTLAGLASFLPDEASVQNPVDMIASATPEGYAQALKILLADENVDMVMVINVKPLIGNPIAVMNEVGKALPGQKKPVVAVMMATEEFHEEVKARPDLPPVYRFPESAARALAQLAHYSALKRRPLEQEIPTFRVDDAAVATLIAASGTGHLPPDKAYQLLELYGIPVARWQVARGRDAVRRAAEEIGYPVVIKAIAEALVHKSDLGGVKVDLRSPEEVDVAVKEIQESLARAEIGAEQFLVQEMATGGHEVIFGITTDTRFGPLLMFGLGGRYVEVFRDVRFGVTPLTPFEAGEMISGIRGFKLLEGVRGEAGADLSILEEVLLRLAQLAQRHPRIQELDINPFLAGADKDTCKALDVRIRVGF